MKFNSIIQWVGAVFIGLGHVLNTLGVEYHNDVWNIASFAVGTVSFLIWTVRVNNRPQMAVNILAIITMAVGLGKALLK